MAAGRLKETRGRKTCWCGNEALLAEVLTRHLRTLHANVAGNTSFFKYTMNLKGKEDVPNLMQHKDLLLECGAWLCGFLLTSGALPGVAPGILISPPLL
jgi:hypothetical protein